MAIKDLLGPPKASGTKTDGIIITDPAIIADTGNWLKANRACAEAAAAKEAIEMSFKPALRRAWFAANAGRAKTSSSLRIVTPEGKLTASFSALWDIKGEAAGLVPKEYLTTKYSIVIKGDLIPDSKAEAVIGEIRAVMAKHGVEEAFLPKHQDYPTEAFATERFRLFSPEQNEAMELAGLCTRLALRG